MKQQNKEFVSYPVICQGRLSFISTPKVDVCSVEAKPTSIGAMLGVEIKPGYYNCYYAFREDQKKVGALMIVHEEYPGEELITEESLGDALVGMSGIFGFFRSPKTVYTKNRLKEYLGDLAKHHNKSIPWAETNSRQFVCPSGQMPGSAIEVWAHRDEHGEIDALKVEFGREGDKNPIAAAKKIEKEQNR